MVIFPDSQQSLPASWEGEVDYVMGLRKASPFFLIFFYFLSFFFLYKDLGAYHLQNKMLHCHYYYLYIF